MEEYIRSQLVEDKNCEQLTMKEPDPFTGSLRQHAVGKSSVRLRGTPFPYLCAAGSFVRNRGTQFP